MLNAELHGEQSVVTDCSTSINPTLGMLHGKVELYDIR